MMRKGLLLDITMTLACAMLLCTTQLSAQVVSDALSIKNIGTVDGLSQNTVRSIITDKQGFLWIGTFDGLNRYDGHEFVIYKPKLGDPHSIDDSQIRSMTLDEAGYIWVRKYDKSHSCYNPKTDRFVDLKDTKGDKPRIPQSSNIVGKDSTILFYNAYDDAFLFKSTDEGVTCIWQDSLRYRSAYYDGENYWMCKTDLVKVNGKGEELRYEMKGVENGRGIILTEDYALIADATSSIHRFDLKRQKRIPDATIEGGLPINYIYRLKNDLMILDCGFSGARLYDAKKNKFFDLDLIGADYLQGKRLYYENDNENGIWLHERKGTLYHYDALNNVVRPVKIMDEGMANVVDDPRIQIICDKIQPGVYWITSYGGGLVRYDENSDKAEQIKSPKAVMPEYCLCINQDNTGNIWVGSEFIGLLKVSPKRYESRNVRPGSDKIDANNNVRSLYESVDGNVWVGIKNGSLQVFDPDLKKELFRKEDMRPYAIIADAQGRIWVGSRGHGIYVYDLTTMAELAHFTHKDDDPTSLINDNIFKIIVDKKDRIWIATFGGGLDLVVEDNLDKIKFQHFLANNAKRKNNIRDVYEDSDGMIWTATADGLLCFSPDKIIRNPEDYVIYQYDLNDPDGISSRDVRTICEDGKKRKWIGTGGGGLNLLTFTTDHVKFKKYTKHNGLPSDIINSIVCTNDTTLWIGTENGISLFNMRKEMFYNMLLTENTICNLINDHACTIRMNGNILWGSLDGIVDFNPRQKVHDMKKPKPTLTSIMANGKSIKYDESGQLDAAVPYAKTLELPAGTDNFTINFATLNLIDKDINEYSYKLEGYDNEWSLPSSYNRAVFDHLKAGTYVFKVRNNEDSTGNATMLTIYIRNYWWATPLAKVFYVLLGLLLIAMPVFIMMRYRREAEQADMDREINEYKMRFFTNINHDIQTPLMGVERAVNSLDDRKDSLPADLVNHIDNLKRDAGSLSELVKKLLEFRKSKEEDDMPLTLEVTNMAPFLDEIFRMFDELATERHIRYSLNVPGGWNVLLDKEKVERVIYCFLSNAFKRTPHGGAISVTANRDENNNCYIAVADNGTPIPVEMRQVIFNNVFDYTSEEGDLNMAMTKNYAEAHHGTVGYAANLEGGSTFTLTIPIDYSQFTDINIISMGVQPNATASEDFSQERNFTNYSPSQSIKVPQPAVLLIDSNNDTRNFLTNRLSNLYIVDTATDTEKAVEIIKKNTPDLIVFSSNLTNNIEKDFVRQLRTDFTTSHLPIIVTGDKVTDKQDEIALAANLYIDTPFCYVELLKAIQRLLDKSFYLLPDFDNFNGAKDEVAMNNLVFKRFLEVVHNNIQRSNFMMDDLTIELQRSRDEIYKEVYKATGCTPGEFVKAYRLDTAKRLIRSGKLSVGQTYQHVGVVNINYFNKCFKRLYGSSLVR